MPLIYTQHPTQRELDHEFRELWKKVDRIKATVETVQQVVEGQPGATGPAGPAGPTGPRGLSPRLSFAQLFDFQMTTPTSRHRLVTFGDTGLGGTGWHWTLMDLGMNILIGSAAGTSARDPDNMADSQRLTGMAGRVKITVIPGQYNWTFYKVSGTNQLASPVVIGTHNYDFPSLNRSRYVLWEHHWPYYREAQYDYFQSAAVQGGAGARPLRRQVPAYNSDPFATPVQLQWHMLSPGRPAANDDWIGYPICPRNAAGLIPDADWIDVQFSTNYTPVCVNCVIYGTIGVGSGGTFQSVPCPFA